MLIITFLLSLIYLFLFHVTVHCTPLSTLTLSSGHIGHQNFNQHLKLGQRKTGLMSSPPSLAQAPSGLLQPVGIFKILKFKEIISREMYFCVIIKEIIHYLRLKHVNFQLLVKRNLSTGMTLWVNLPLLISYWSWLTSIRK